MLSDETIRALILDQFGNLLNERDIDRLVPLVKRQYDTSEKLASFDFGGLDSGSTEYITDRRIAP
jgi:hypothetical protein